jgi:hypothetical protein
MHAAAERGRCPTKRTSPITLVGGHRQDVFSGMPHLLAIGAVTPQNTLQSRLCSIILGVFWFNGDGATQTADFIIGAIPLQGKTLEDWGRPCRVNGEPMEQLPLAPMLRPHGEEVSDHIHGGDRRAGHRDPRQPMPPSVRPEEVRRLH